MKLPASQSREPHRGQFGQCSSNARSHDRCIRYHSKSSDHSDQTAEFQSPAIKAVGVYKGSRLKHLPSVWASPSGCWALTSHLRESFKTLCLLVRGLGTPHEALVLGRIEKTMDIVDMMLHLHLHLDRGRERAWFDCRTDVQPSPAIYRHLTGNQIEMNAALVI